MKTVLTIAGSDSSGGAGIQADLKTFACNGVYGMSAITALTAQNTTGVFAIQEVTPDFLSEQIKAVAQDIFPNAVKIGMVSSCSLIKVIASSIKEYNFKNVIVDPVMVATSGSKLISDDSIKTLTEELFPLATLITPNIPEAEILSKVKITSENDMEQAASIINKKYGCNVLLKGGHSVNDANDFLLEKENGTWIKGERVQNENTHGTGCTLSSAIAANLAKELSLKDSVTLAKKYLSTCLSQMLNLGKGSGPIMHNFAFIQN